MKVKGKKIKIKSGKGLFNLFFIFIFVAVSIGRDATSILKNSDAPFAFILFHQGPKVHSSIGRRRSSFRPSDHY